MVHQNLVAQQANQSQWGPDSIGTIAFDVLMALLGIVALWQGRQRMLQHAIGK